jgi:mRNA interferase MazF
VGLTRGEVYLVRLDPVVGHEVGKTRPCVVVSPDEANAIAGTITVAPLSTQLRPYPARVDIEFGGRVGQIQLDQIRSISPLRLVARVGELKPSDLLRTLSRLCEIFAP